MAGEAQEDGENLRNKGNKEEIDQFIKVIVACQDLSANHVPPQPPTHNQTIQPLRGRLFHLLRTIIRIKRRTLPVHDERMPLTLSFLIASLKIHQASHLGPDLHS